MTEPASIRRKATLGVEDPEAPMTQGQAMLLMREMSEIKSLLQQQVNNHPSHLSVKEFAQLAGMGASTVSLYINKGRIAADKLGGRTSPWRIPYSELERINSRAP